MHNDPIDLAALDTSRGAEEGRELDVRHFQTGEPIGLRITLLGTDSETYQKAVRAQQRSMQALLLKNRRHRVTAEEMEDNALDLLVALTRGWSPFNLDGQDYPYSPANARALYRRFGWIREQADQYAQERANFLPRSATA